MAGKEIPTLIGGLLALVALGSSLLNQVSPTESLTRGGIAFAVGYFAGIVWNIFFTGSASPAKREENSAEGVGAESVESQPTS